jgi:hypothetical protein
MLVKVPLKSSQLAARPKGRIAVRACRSGKMLHSKVYGHGFPKSFQFGELNFIDDVYRPMSFTVDKASQLDFVFGKADALWHPYLQIEELLAVYVFRDTETHRFSTLAPPYG